MESQLPLALVGTVPMINFRHTDSLKHNEWARGKWVSWCSRKEMLPTRFNTSYILDILAELFDEALQYNTIESHRPPIPTFYDPTEEKKIGNHSRVSNFIILCLGYLIIKDPKKKSTLFYGTLK